MTRSAFEPQGNVRLRPDRHKKLLNGYPWAHKGDLQSADPGLEPGGLVRIESSQGEFVGIGSYLPEGRFPVRLFTNRDERIDERFFLGRFESALKRRPVAEWNTDAFRALFSEADGVPGLVLDVYRKRLVVQVRSMGMERLREAWMPALLKAFEPDSILERSDMAGRLEEGLEPLVADLYGTSPDEVPLTEGGLEFRAQIRSGPKTGFYLDQRESRALLRASVRPNDKVLDLFCFSGAFAISAAAAGARVTGIDLLPEAIRLAKAHANTNGIEANFVEANVFDWLEGGLARETYDWIVIDPPAISKSREKSDSLKWAIWKLVYHSLPVLAEGGRLAVFSCSYALSLQTLMETVRMAASDRGRRLFVERITLQPPDHPYLLQFPESLYLKGLWVQAE